MRNQQNLIADLELLADMLSRELRKVNKLSEESDLPIAEGRVSIADVNKIREGLVEAHEALSRARGEASQGQGEGPDVSKLSLDEARELARLMRKGAR
ncbi:MAG: hypothetical protein U0183_10755 [Polyangiaceae bacterium]